MDREPRRIAPEKELAAATPLNGVAVCEIDGGVIFEWTDAAVRGNQFTAVRKG